MKKFALIALVLLIAVAPVFAAKVKDVPYVNCPISIYQAYSTDPTGAYKQAGYKDINKQTITAVPGILAICPGGEDKFNADGFPQFWANFAWPAKFGIDDWYVKGAVLTKYHPVVGQCSLYAPTNSAGQVVGAPYYKAKPAIVQYENYNAYSGLVPGSLSPYGDIVGSKIRLWWPLAFEAPGTIFQLVLTTGTENVASATDSATGWSSGPVPMTIHTDTWTWVVDANFESLEAAITLFHELPFGTCEYPLIQDEKLWNHDLVVYDNAYEPPIIQDDPRYDKTLIEQVEAIQCALKPINGISDLSQARRLLVDFENNLWFACNPSTKCDPTAEPTNPSTGTNGKAPLGIANTDCYPACCKLVIDTEYIANVTGIYGNKPIADVLDVYGRQFDPTTGYGFKGTGKNRCLYKVQDPVLPPCFQAIATP